jgi:Tfp pilus assembly protein PilO
MSAIIFALAFFLFFALVLPQYDELQNAGSALKDRQALLSERTADMNNFRKLSQQADSRQGDIAKIKTFLPNNKQIDQVLSSIQQITNQSGLQLTDLTTSQGPDSSTETGYKVLNIDLSLSGKYVAFTAFLSYLEQSLRLYDIYEMTAAQTVTNGTGGLLLLSLKMNAYFLK